MASALCTLFRLPAQAGHLWGSRCRLRRADGDTCYGSLIDIKGKGGIVEIKGGVTLNNYTGVSVSLSHGVCLDSGPFSMSGGTIENCSYGVVAHGSNVSIYLAL